MSHLPKIIIGAAGLLFLVFFISWMTDVPVVTYKTENEVIRVCDPGLMKMRGDRVEKDEDGRLWYVDRRGRRTLTNTAVLDEVCRPPKKGMFK